SALYPRVDADLEITRERFSAKGETPPPFAGSWSTLNQLQATLNWEIDLWGKNRAAYESALGQAKAATVDAYAARLALSTNLGQGPDRGLAIARPATTAARPVALPSTLPAELLGRRPDLVARRARVEAAQQDIASAKAEFYPNVNLIAFVGLQSLGGAGFLSAASRMMGFGPAASLPIFDAGRLRANLAGKN